MRTARVEAAAIKDKSEASVLNSFTKMNARARRHGSEVRQDHNLVDGTTGVKIKELVETLVR